MTQNLSRRFSLCLTLMAAGGSLLMAGQATAELPDQLENIVFGDEKRTPITLDIIGTTFDSHATHASTPYLIWLEDERDAAPFPAELDAVLEWLTNASTDLGFDGFTPRYLGESFWRSNNVWLFELERQGLMLHDARIEVHWDADRFLGIVIHIPGNIVSIQDRAVPANEEWVYYPMRESAFDYTLAPVRVHRADLGDRMEITFDAPKGAIKRIAQKPGQIILSRGVEFTEYNVPGTFPDQISVDPADGIVWLSQPNNNWLTEFDPKTEQFTTHPTTGGSGPDGMIVGSSSLVWTGLYFGGGLGRYDSINEQFQQWNAPYSPNAMAIPVETSDGMIWTTDHANNKITEFNPNTNQYLQTLNMPTPSCWVVQGYEDLDNNQVYFTEYNANQLGRLAVGGSAVTDIQVGGGGPAFCVYHEGIVYYSRWTEAGIGAYDVSTGQTTEYQFPVSGESGGPMWIAPNGDIVTGTRNAGYIMVFHPDTETFDAYQIPTSFPGLKDGMTVGPDGVVWFTESGVAKLGKLELLPPPCNGDVNGNGTVNTDDLLALLAQWGTQTLCPPFEPADLDEDCDVDTDDLLGLLANWGSCPG